MTLEQQVHQLEVQVQRLKERVAALEKDSHPPVPIADVVRQVLKEQGLGANL